MISYCLLKGRQGDPKCRGSSPKVRAGIWGASPTPEPSLVLCLPGHSSSKAGVPGWNPGPGGSPVPLCQTHTGKSSKMKWANMCQMSIPSQHSDAFFFFLRTWMLQKLGSLQVKNTELALRSVHLLLSWLPFLLLVQQTYWTESALGPIPALKFSSSCEHTLTDAGKKVKLF